MVGASKALWLANSANLLVFGAIFAWLALRPRDTSSIVLALLGLGPLASGLLLYWFMGMFIAAHSMVASAILVFAAAILDSRTGARAAG